jgi:hypothetical protein
VDRLCHKRSFTGLTNTSFSAIVQQSGSETGVPNNSIYATSRYCACQAKLCVVIFLPLATFIKPHFKEERKIIYE